MPRAHLSAFDATYEKGAILGRGASGVAFVVRPKGGPEVQVEQVAKEICVGRFDEKRRKDAFEESKMLRTLNHQNIVKCLDTFLDDEVLYIVMEYANGGDLGRCIQAQRKETSLFLEQTVMGVFVQTCAACLHIHSRKILHRDLKPANVFIVGEGDLSTSTVKLGDFGIAKMLEGTTCQAHSTVGTPSYLSPEICKNNPYGTKSDVWSLGVVLYELAVLKVPFQAGNLPAMALMICTNEPKPLPDGFSEPLEKLVRALLQKDPSKRPPVGDVLHSSFVQTFLSEALVRCIANDCAGQAKPNVQNAQSRGASLPNHRGRVADCSNARLPSCGPSTTRRKTDKFLLTEDASQWCWQRSNPGENSGLQGTEKTNTKPRASSPRSRGERGERPQRSDRGEKVDRGDRGDRAERKHLDRSGSGCELTGFSEVGGATGSRAPQADRIERPEVTRDRVAPSGYDRTARADAFERVDRSEMIDGRRLNDKAERGDKVDRADRVDRGDRFDRGERGVTGTRAPQVDRTTSGMSEVTGLTEFGGSTGSRAPQVFRTEPSARADTCERADRAERGMRDASDKADRSEQGYRPEKSDRGAGGMDRRTNRADRADRADRGGARGIKESAREKRIEQNTQGYRSDLCVRACHGDCNGHCESCERGERCYWLEKASTGSRGEQASTGSRGGTPDDGIQQMSSGLNVTLESVNAQEHSPLADTTDEEFNCNDASPAAEVLPPAQMQEPAPPGAGPPPGSTLLHGNSEFAPRTRNKTKLRRGRPPKLAGQDAPDYIEPRSPTHIQNKKCFEEESPDKRTALSSTAPVNTSATSSAAPPGYGSTAPLPLGARSVSPARALEGLTIPNVPNPISTGLRSSGSTPALPPLPPLLAPSRGPVRSRSVAGLHEARGEALQRGSLQMFRTAPLTVSNDRDGNGNMTQGPPPPSLAPPPQPQRQPPPPPQRQAPKDDPDRVRLAPKLLTSISAQSDSRHRREPAQASVNRVEATPVCEDWCEVDARLASGRLQSVI